VICLMADAILTRHVLPWGFCGVVELVARCIVCLLQVLLVVLMSWNMSFHWILIEQHEPELWSSPLKLAGSFLFIICERCAKMSKATEGEVDRDLCACGPWERV